MIIALAKFGDEVRPLAIVVMAEVATLITGAARASAGRSASRTRRGVGGDETLLMLLKFSKGLNRAGGIGTNCRPSAGPGTAPLEPNAGTAEPPDEATSPLQELCLNGQVKSGQRGMQYTMAATMKRAAERVMPAERILAFRPIFRDFSAASSACLFASFRASICRRASSLSSPSHSWRISSLLLWWSLTVASRRKKKLVPDATRARTAALSRGLTLPKPVRHPRQESRAGARSMRKLILPSSGRGTDGAAGSAGTAAGAAAAGNGAWRDGARASAPIDSVEAKRLPMASPPVRGARNAPIVQDSTGGRPARAVGKDRHPGRRARGGGPAPLPTEPPEAPGPPLAHPKKRGCRLGAPALGWGPWTT